MHRWRRGIERASLGDCHPSSVTERRAREAAEYVGALRSRNRRAVASGDSARPHPNHRSYISIEPNTSTPVAEWGGKKVFVMMEDCAYLTADGYRFFRPRQEAFYLIAADRR